MKTFTNYAEKKAKQFLNLLQGYTKSIRITAILILLLMGVSEAHAWGWVKYESTSPATIYPGDKVEIQMLLNGDANEASYKRFGYGTTNSKAGLTWSENYNWIEKVSSDNRWKFNFTPTSATTYYWSLWIGWGNSVGDNGRYYKTGDWNEGSGSYQSASVTVKAVPTVTAFTATAQSTSSIALSWTKNSLNDDVLIVQGSSTAPTQGTSYSNGNAIGTGKVVYKGSATSTTITDLSASTSYTFYIYSIHNSKYYSASTSATATTKTPTYSYTVTAGAGGSVTPTSGTVEQGSGVTIEAIPDDGYEFDKWTATNGTLADANSASTTFTPSANDANAKAWFKVAGCTQTPTTPTSLTAKVGGNALVGEVCSGTNVTLTAGGTISVGSLQWGTGTVGENIIAEGNGRSSITVSPAATTTYWVRSIITEAGVCYGVTSDAKTLQVSVTPALVQPVLSESTLTLEEGGATGSITVTSGTTGGTWTSSDQNVATVNNGTVTPVGPGTATITYTVSNGCEEDKTATCDITITAKPYYIAGRLQQNWNTSSKTQQFTYVSNGQYKYETGKTVAELSAQWQDNSYTADQYFFIHAGGGLSKSFASSSSNGHKFHQKLGYENALALSSNTSDEQAKYIKFADITDNSSDVVIWWEPSTNKLWYTATANLNTNYYLLGFGSSNWDVKDARRFVKDGNDQTKAKVTITLAQSEYKYNTNDGFKINDNFTGKWYGNNSTMTRKSCTGWSFEEGKNNAGLTADIAGDYVFTLDLTTMKLSVTYPEAYTVTYSRTPTAAADAPTTDPSITSGKYVAAGTSVTFTAKDAKTGYRWEGWYDNSEGTGEALSTDKVYTRSITANTTIYAVYTAKTSKVTLNPQPGEGGTTSVDATAGSAMPDIEIPTRIGYDFGGYYDQEAGNGTQYYNESGKSAKDWDKEGDVTLYAKWTATPYTITYHLDGGTGASNTTYTIESEEITLPTPTKTGFTFAGWYDSSEFNGEAITTIASGSTGDKEFWAKWNIGTYAVTLDMEGGNGGTASVNVAYGAAMPTITIPTKNDHLFDGYYDGDNGTGTKYYNADGTSAKNWNKETATLYARWIPYSQCIFFKNTLSWSNVYVYTFSNNVWYDSEDSNTQYGPGVCTKVNVLEFAEMTQIDNTDIYYYILTKQNGFNHIAFSDANMNNWNEFYGNNAVYRSDRSDQMPLFIPQTDQTASTTNSTKYYSSGIWMKYNSTESGYKWSSDKNAWSTDVNPFTASTKGGYTFTTTVSLSGNTTYQFKVNNIKGDWYSKVSTMTQDDCTDWWFQPESDTEKNATIKPNVTGDYVFTVYLGDGKVELSLEYPLSVEDYRLSYYDAKTGLHPGHYIKKRNEDRRDTVSFFVHIENNPEIRLERCTAIDANTSTATWELMKTYPVLKTSGANPTSAQLPGKRKSDAVLYTGEGCGIDSTGVYNFILQQSNSTAEVITDETHPYEGKYYIRTDAAAGGWDAFRQAGNKMTYSSYADKNQDFDHYFCKWITQGTNIKFVIANEYSLCISDTLNGDDIVGNTGEHIGYLPADANVRFGWDGKTNEVSRAYISGSGKSQDRFLVLTGNKYLLDIKGNAIPEGTEADNRLGLNEHELLFSDKQNWIYQLDVKANSNTEITLTAQYNEETQTFFSTSKSGEVMQATNDDYHKVRMIYDFKTNNLIAAWLLETPVQETEAKSVASNMLIIREDQGDANQINFTQNQNMEINTAYAVMTFTQEWVKGANTRDRSEYWVSFPFDVKISDVFGFSEYGDQWIMQLYDGAERAEKGNWIDSPTFWKYITNRNYTLRAGVGYVLKLNPSKMTFDHGATDVSLFFPSQGIPTVINAKPTPITVPAHTCTIERDNRNIYDSHWNLIGVPGYANLENLKVDKLNQTVTIENEARNLAFYYAYDAANNNYNTELATATFKNMHAYMVQYAGELAWTNIQETPAQLAARRNSDIEPEKRTLRLEIAQGEEVADQTFVQLQQEGATPEFDMNLDLTKIINSGANIYTLAGDARIQVAGNALPIAETTIPVGVQMATAGEYTFRMPDGTEGMVVELIDYETNTRTNLLLSDYTTTLPAGCFENRFALIVKPDKVATDVENIGQAAQNGEAAKKYIIDGKLYLQKGGLLYDAQGHIVR